jgi:hypothetical protein
VKRRLVTLAAAASLLLCLATVTLWVRRRIKGTSLILCLHLLWPPGIEANKGDITDFMPSSSLAARH